MIETMGDARAASGDKACASVDLTTRILGDLMHETLALMDATVAMGDARTASGKASPHETALGLRLAARLARVGAWLMTHAPEADELAEADRADERRAARLGLEAARRGGLDGADQFGPFAALSARIDRLVDRTLRLDARLGEPTPEPLAPPAVGGRVLAFRPRHGLPAH